VSLVVIQRGHVPRRTGATGTTGEQAFAIDAAARAALHVRRIGHQSRIINADVADSEYRGDMFVAIHYDGSTNPTASGASVGYQTPEGAALARTWKRHYTANGWTRAYKPDNYTRALAGYYGVRHAVAVGNKRAIIIEAGFITNRHDAALIQNGGAERVGICIAACMVDVFGGVCPPKAQPAGLPKYPGVVKLGDRGDAVKVWQLQFTRKGKRLAVDGVFGPATHRVVMDWQTSHNLSVDGIAGPATWHSLLFSR
jgi:hypothetical protein